MKSTAERTIEALTWASVVIWLGMALLFHLLDYVWLIVLGLSIILLTSAIYQRSRGWQTSLSIWIFGVWMAVSSVLELVNAMLSASGGGLHIDLWVYLGLALVSMGVAVVLRMIRGPNLSLDIGNRGRNTQQSYTAPRPVYDNLSYGSTPSPQEQNSAYSGLPGRRGTTGYTQQQPYDQNTTYAQTNYTQRTDLRYQQDQAAYDQGGNYGYNNGYAATDQAPRYNQGDEYDYGNDQAAYDQPGYTGNVPGVRRNQSGYSTPPAYDSRTAPANNAGVYQEPSGYANGYSANGYSAPAYPDQQQAAQRAAQQSAPRAVSDRRRANVQRARQAPAQPQASDLDARIEDIIRRSRERRNTPPEDLPY